MGDSAVLRPAPAASGTLAKTPLVHLLVYVHDRKLSGTIELITGDKRASASIRFLAGEPAKVRTNAVVAYLGTVLLELGYLSDRQLDDSLAELQAAKGAGRPGAPVLHGGLLLDRRTIDRKQLETALREQVARKLKAVAAMPPETMYGFYDGFDGLRGWGGEVDQGYDPLAMLWGILGANPPMEHITAGLARIGPAQLRLVRNSDVARFALDEPGRKVVELLRGRACSVGELVAQSGVNERAVALLAYLLLVTKQVDVLRGQDAARSPSSPQRAASPSAPAESRPDSRAPSGPHSVPKMPAVSRSGKQAAVLPPPPASLPGELAARWQEIVDRATTIDRADYFMMLDVARDATREQVEASFFALAKAWHPDRVPAELAPVRDACSRVFARMSEAHATLTDDAKRKNYMTLLADGSGSPEMQESVAKVIEAATDFQKAEVCFKRNDLAQAELWCRKATEGDPTQPNYRALLAWLVSLKPESQSPESTLESIKVLDAALAVNERAEAAHVWRGLLYKRVGKDDLAMRDFKRAVELNPRNIDAAREVRLFTMRSRSNMQAVRPADAGVSPPKPDDGGKSGLLGRLFKK